MGRAGILPALRKSRERRFVDLNQGLFPHTFHIGGGFCFRHALALEFALAGKCLKR
ncbi:hypothetical protein BH11ARM2_BH11ARM2_39850 [soil metagenome]